MVRILSAALLVLALGPVPQPPQRPIPTSAPRAANARIRGRVVAVDTGRGLRRALVVVARTGAMAQPRTYDTDALGRFDLTLPPGAYMLSAQRDGYVTATYGQRRPGGPGQAVRVEAGQVLDVTLSLPRLSVLSGRVLDELGEPVAGVNVAVMRPRYSQGKRRLVRADERGAR